MLDMTTIDDNALVLINDLAERLMDFHSFGTMSASVYDTAWVSMVTRSSADGRTWAFPQAFEYLLSTQQSDGSWPWYSSQIDCILNTATALYALLVHQELGLPSQTGLIELNERIEKATISLRTILDDWDINSCVHVGFEILVPNILRLLSRHNVVFDFPASRQLTSLNEKKLSRFRPESLYSSRPTTLLHSLEALIDSIDFRRVKHHMRNGAFMGSPSSTAAYLISSPESEEGEAFDFIKRALESTGCGAVPSAFPTSIFELSWSLSTLLSAGFCLKEPGFERALEAVDWLERVFDHQEKLLGFTPDVLPDADDTAKCIYILNQCGRRPDISPMIEEFVDGTNFRTYKHESSPSFSANCNVLLAILSSSSASLHVTKIHGVATFLCDTWNMGRVRDKWNLTVEYSSMLFAQALSDLVQFSSSEGANESLRTFVKDRAIIAAFQVLSRTILSQRLDGSWSASIERTAYAVLAICRASRLFPDGMVQSFASTAVSRAQDFLGLRVSSWTAAERLWVEKVSYGSPLLANSYCIAAMKAACVGKLQQQGFGATFGISDSRTEQMCKFFSSIPMLSTMSSEAIKLAIMEAQLYFERITRIKSNIFDRSGMTEDKYLQYIPITWTVCNASQGWILSNDTTWEMMVISMLNYQVDEFMETVVASLSEPSISLLETIIKEKCQWGLRKDFTGTFRYESLSEVSTFWRPTDSPPTPVSGSVSPQLSLKCVVEILGGFIAHIKSHPSLLKSSDRVQAKVGQEVAVFLLAHITHNRDNEHLHRARQPSRIGALNLNQGPDFLNYSGRSYFNWVRTTSADHTSCPYSFAFFNCLMNENVYDHPVRSARPAYLGEALCRHLATMCRQYNDYGSLDRDRLECNFNSLDFPEFGLSKGPTVDFEHLKSWSGQPAPNSDQPSSTASTTGEMSVAKEQLMSIAEFERSCVELSMSGLRSCISTDAADALQVFVKVTDLYGQIYVARDIASRMKFASDETER